MDSSTHVNLWERLWRSSGIIFAVFFVLAYAFYGLQPKIGASADTLVSFYDGHRMRILMATMLFGWAVLFLLWFAAAIRSVLHDGGQGGWGAAASASSAALGGLIAVGAALAYSIASLGNDALTSALNDLVWACIVVPPPTPPQRRLRRPLGPTNRAKDCSVPQRRRILSCQRLGGGTIMANHPRVVGKGDLEWSEHSHGERFGYRRKHLGSSAGGEMLGCSLYEVPPGRRAWPYHYQLANEEVIYVLEGSGTLRISGEEIGVSKGEYVALPAREQVAHQIINDSGVVLSGTSASPRWSNRM